MTEQLIFGPPGCGKTHTLMEIIRSELNSGTPPDRIGFVSFSRKAVNEARERAGAAFNLTEKDTPYFRTLHSLGFKWLGMKTVQMINAYDLAKIGTDMGLFFDNRDVFDEDGLMMQSAREGNKYMTIIHRAAMRRVSLDKEFNLTGDHRLHFPILVKLSKLYNSYKEETGKHDFTDMIKLMVEQGTAPVLDLLIVDEAQDLTPLQWEQVKLLRNNAKRVYYAGDDDQAIFKYTGVDIRCMLNVCDDLKILEQSYRVPRAVHHLANKISSMIGTRKIKNWEPTNHDGSIRHYISINQIDMDEGSWTVMARTTKNLRALGDNLKAMGILYKINDSLSFNEKLLRSINLWKELQAGEFISVEEAELLYSHLPKRGNDAMVKYGMAKTLKEVDSEKPLTYNALVEDHGLLASKELIAEKLLRISEEELRYLNAIRRRGKISTDPSIKLSTIHRMKGGEDDNIVLLDDMGYLPYKNYVEGNPDDEHRVFYTAVTRTRQNLHIVQTGSKHRYPL